MQPAAATRIRIVLADDHDLVRSAIKALLATIDGVEVIAEARDGRELLTVLGGVTPDLVMTDISMPGMDGITAIAEIRDRHPGMKVLALSMHDSADIVKRAMASGACGYLLKDASPFELEQALGSVMAVGSYFSPAIVERLMQPALRTAEDDLTQRQIEVLTLIAQGRASKEIAFALGLSPKTVNVHRARIMGRLRLGDIASLTLYAVRKGLVTP